MTPNKDLNRNTEDESMKALLESDDPIIVFYADVTLQEEEGDGDTNKLKFASVAIEPGDFNNTLITSELIASNVEGWQGLDYLNTHNDEDVLNVIGEITKSFLQGNKLMVEGFVDKTTDKGEKVAPYMIKGKVGLSIGARILDWKWNEEQDIFEILSWEPHHIANIRKGSQAVPSAVPHRVGFALSKGLKSAFETSLQEMKKVTDETTRLNTELKEKEVKVTELQDEVKTLTAEKTKLSDELAAYVAKEEATLKTELVDKVKELTLKAGREAPTDLEAKELDDLKKLKLDLALEIADKVELSTKKVRDPVKAGDRNDMSDTKGGEMSFAGRKEG